MSTSWYGDPYAPFNGRNDPVQQGFVDISVSGTPGAGSSAVSFTPNFIGAPIVSLTVTGTSVYHPSTNATPTTSGMTVQVRHIDSTSPGSGSVRVHWTAREP